MLALHGSSPDRKECRAGTVEHDVLLVVNAMAVMASIRVRGWVDVRTFGSVSSMAHPIIEDEGSASSMPIGFSTLGG